MTEEEQALNRKIAECFEPCPTEPPRLDSESWSKTGAWSYAGTGPCVSLIFGNSEEWQPRDFLHDETANAMLLDSMPEPNLFVESMKGERRYWGCVPDIDKDTVNGFAYDRKAAVCQAFLAMHKKEKA